MHQLESLVSKGCPRELMRAHVHCYLKRSVPLSLSGDSNRYAHHRRKRTNGRDPQSLHIKRIPGLIWLFQAQKPGVRLTKTLEQ